MERKRQPVQPRKRTGQPIHRVCTLVARTAVERREQFDRIRVCDEQADREQRLAKLVEGRVVQELTEPPPAPADQAAQDDQRKARVQLTGHEERRKNGRKTPDRKKRVRGKSW